MSASYETVDLETVQVSDDEHWVDGPPHALFARLRTECPVHWSKGAARNPDAAGFWSVTKAEHVREVSLDWETYSSGHGFLLDSLGFPVPVQQQMMIGMDPPVHDRIKSLFQRGMTPKAITAHEPTIRELTAKVLDGVQGRETVDLVTEVAQPVVARVFHDFMGLPEEDDAYWTSVADRLVRVGDPAAQEGDIATFATEFLPSVFMRLMEIIIAKRAEPADDMISTLISAEIDGQTLTDEEIFAGSILLLTAGNDSTKSTYSSVMHALLRNPSAWRELVDDPSLVPGAIEEALRMFPAFGHFRRTAMKDTVLGGCPIKAGDQLALWYPSSNLDEDVYPDASTFDIRRNPDHQAFGAGGRHFCLGAALARLELRILVEATISRFPEMRLVGTPVRVASPIAQQFESLTVRLG